MYQVLRDDLSVDNNAVQRDQGDLTAHFIQYNVKRSLKRWRRILQSKRHPDKSEETMKAAKRGLATVCLVFPVSSAAVSCGFGESVSQQVNAFCHL